MCDASGQCACRPEVGGVRCDVCSDPTLAFPTCAPCDECTDQWLDRIAMLEFLVRDAIDRIHNLTSNQTDNPQLPELETLFSLLTMIGGVLDESMVETLSVDVRSTHSLICDLINTTQFLVERSLSLEKLQDVTENATLEFIEVFLDVARPLFDIIYALDNVTEFLDSLDIQRAQSLINRYDQIALEANEIFIQADRLVRPSFYFTIDEIRDILRNYNNLSEDVIVQNDDLVSQLEEQNLRLDALEAFVDDVSVTVCGAEGNGSCEECGGVGCGMCGEGDDCEGLSGQAAESANKSSLALSRANELLSEIQSTIPNLNELIDMALNLIADSANVIGNAEETQISAEVLLAEVQNLLVEIDAELDQTRIDPNMIGSNVNATLALQLALSLDQVMKKLILCILVISFSIL